MGKDNNTPLVKKIKINKVVQWWLYHAINRSNKVRTISPLSSTTAEQKQNLLRIITFPPTLINPFRKIKTSYVCKTHKTHKTLTIEFFYVNFNLRGNKWVYSLQIRASTYVHAYILTLMHYKFNAQIQLFIIMHICIKISGFTRKL